VRARPEGPRGRLLTVDVPAGHTAAYLTAGQYCALSIQGETGWFAVASPPSIAPFEFYVQPGGGSSDLLLNAPIGAPVEVGLPQGKGYRIERALRTDDPLYLLATGSGYSGVRACLARIEAVGRTARIYVGARTVSDLLFDTEYEGLRAVGIEVVEVLSRASATWAGRHGYVQTAFAEDVDRLDEAWVIACGQPEMQSQSRALAESLGLPADRFLTNY
jgi:CDP-4-dehydro-6-deoxyglucose reductase